MPQGGYLEQKPRSPTGLAIVIVAHVAVLSALALSKMEVPVPQFLGPLKIRNIELPKDPPPLPPEPKVEPREVPQHKTVITRPDPIVKTQTESVFELTRQEPVELTWVNTKPGPIDIPRVEPPPRPLLAFSAAVSAAQGPALQSIRAAASAAAARKARSSGAAWESTGPSIMCHQSAASGTVLRLGRIASQAASPMPDGRRSATAS